MTEIGRAGGSVLRVSGCLAAVAVLLTLSPTAVIAAPAQDPTCYPPEGADLASRAKVELACLDQLRGIASRKGDRLSVETADGRRKSFKSRPKACEADEPSRCLVVRIVSYLKSLDVVVLEQSGYESRSYLLIDRQSGRRFEVGDRPVLSPDRSQFVVAMGSEVSEPNGVEVWSKSGGALVKTWSYHVPTEKYELYQFDHWVTNDDVVLKADKRVGCEIKTSSVHLRRSGAGWALSDR